MEITVLSRIRQARPKTKSPSPYAPRNLPSVQLVQEPLQLAKICHMLDANRISIRS